MAVIADDDLVTRIVTERLAASRAERREQHDRPLCSTGCGRQVRLAQSGARVGPAHPDGLCTTCKQREDARARRAARRAAFEALPEGVDARICHRCHLPGAVGEMTRLHLGTYQRRSRPPKSGNGVAQSYIWLCATCTEQRRQRDAHPEPHPAPARLLRAFLMMDREQGIEFEQAFAWSVEDVLKRLPAATSAEQRERDQWREAFEDMRAAWERGYHHQSVLQRPITFDLLESDTAEVERVELVA